MLVDNPREEADTYWTKCVGQCSPSQVQLFREGINGGFRNMLGTHNLIHGGLYILVSQE